MNTSTKKILQKAQKQGYAVGAFNINNMEIAQAVVEAAEREKSPVILQTSEGAVNYAGMDMLVSISKQVAGRADVPVVLHFDHGKNINMVTAAITEGYDSVMYDGSSHSFENNIKNTKLIVEKAHKKGASVEAELGAIAGIEDFVSVEEKDANLTNPEQAKEFVKETKCDFLAIAIGTSHGAYKFSKKSNLDMKRLEEIRKQVSVPLVLHGASSVPRKIVKKIDKLGGDIGKAKGVSDRNLKNAVKGGICKVNTDTDLRLAFTLGVRNSLKKNPEYFDPRKILKPAYEEMVDIVRWKIRLLGSKGKA
jgi:fructose-bisphosphate aldolase, class II